MSQLPTTMTAIEIDEPGGPEVLRADDAADAAAGRRRGR